MAKYRALAQLEAALTKIGGDEGLELLLADKLVLVDPEKGRKSFKAPDSNPLFTFAGTFKSPGAKEFVAKTKYVVDTSESARVRISYLGGNFKKHVLPLIERDIAPCDLTLSKLARDQHDLPMSLEEPGTVMGLGGLSKAAASACEFYETLAHKQATGNLTWTVGYVRVKDKDCNTVLWALRAYWLGGGWLVEAYSVDYPRRWRADLEFVSR